MVMNKESLMFRKLFCIFECSRIFSLPMSILSWLIVFMYSISDSGNIFYGILTLIGICFAHLGTNLIDDLIDYKYLMKSVDFDKKTYLQNSQKTKCRYLVSGALTEKQVIFIISIYFSISTIIGLFLYLKCGIGVIYFAVIGGIIGLLYPFLSRICLSEFAVGLTYGPVLFGGVYYSMTESYSNEVFILSIPSMIMTIVLLYIHTVMDYDFDTNEGKKTISNRFNSQLESLIILKWLLIFAYSTVVLLCIFDIADWQVFLTFLTIPLAVDLYQSLKLFSENPETVPEKRWYHFPMENWKRLEERQETSFMMRMYQSRNLMIYFSTFLTLGIVLSLLI